jgi:uncharacterized protein (UPF0262 family)
MVVESHEQAVAEGGSEARIQAIDMGRRGLHNEGANCSRDGWPARSRSTSRRRAGCSPWSCALHQRICTA